MSKLGDFYVGVLDLFSALLPGAVTLGAAFSLGVLAPPSELLRRFPLHTEGERAGGFLLAAYVVGQVSSSVGGLVLDPLYDVLYAPGKGLLAPSKEPPAGGLVGRLGRALGALVGDVMEKGSDARKEALERELASLGGVSNVQPDEGFGPASVGSGLYRQVRTYLRTCMPDAFADIEKLEGEQKFFRSLTVGAFALAALLRWTAGASERADLAAPLALLGVVLFVRYVSVRRKTILTTYLYFSARRWGARERREGASGGAARKDDADE